MNYQSKNMDVGRLEALFAVYSNAQGSAETAAKWGEENHEYWFKRLFEEVSEAGECIFTGDENPNDLNNELIQIAGICVSWLAMRGFDE